MSEVLLITDDLRQAKMLARDLGGPTVCSIHDLYEEPRGFDRPETIVSDIRDMNSDALMRLRRCLGVSALHGLPHLFLVHGNAARGEMQARLLGAETLPAATAARLLSARLKSATRPVLLPAASEKAIKRAQEAGQFLKYRFFSGEAVTPAHADIGTEFVAQAIHEAGINDWIGAVQRFDDATHQHILLVAGLSVAFGLTLRLNARDRHQLARAALLHDVGKTKIPTTILNKPGKLDPDEQIIMRSHAAVGHSMLVGSGFDETSLTVVRSHHEMLDGSGYPDGLQAHQIPDLVRLVTVCDIYAALIERRPYKVPMPQEAALKILNDMRGKLDKDLVRAFQAVAASVDFPMHESAL